MGAFHDFDAAREERQAQAPSIKLFGETITLPAARPVAMVLNQRRLAADPAHVMTLDDWCALLGPMFGADRVRRWVEQDGMDEDDLADLMVTLPTLYADDSDEDEPEGEAEAPTTQGPTSTTSSPAGGSSEPTTSVSTAGT